jgi:hypothetical protein
VSKALEASLRESSRSRRKTDSHNPHDKKRTEEVSFLQFGRDLLLVLWIRISFIVDPDPDRRVPSLLPLGRGPPVGCRAEIRTWACHTASDALLSGSEEIRWLI